jgi:hypothetical protein
MNTKLALQSLRRPWLAQPHQQKNHARLSATPQSERKPEELRKSSQFPATQLQFCPAVSTPPPFFCAHDNVSLSVCRSKFIAGAARRQTVCCCRNSTRQCIQRAINFRYGRAYAYAYAYAYAHLLPKASATGSGPYESITSIQCRQVCICLAC